MTDRRPQVRGQEQADAFLLHRKPYSDSSLLIECFTPAHGRLPLIARGVHGRKHSPQAGLLQPFTPLQIQWRGRGEVKNLGRVEPAGTPCSLAGSRLFCGLYMNELLMRLLQRNDPHEQLFVRYGSALREISGGSDVENTLRRFELGLLSDLGYGVDLTRDHETGGEIAVDGQYYCHPGAGLAALKRAGGVPVSGRTVALLTSGATLDPEALREAKNLTRQLLAFYLDDRPLKSRELFKTF